MRLRLFAEGSTEQTFADNVLKQHLANFGVYMEKPVLIAHARKKGKVHQGGGRNFAPMQNDIHRFLRQESGDDVFFFDNAKSQISALQKMIDEVPSPELIDEGQHAAPSKRILTQFPDYSKVTTGPQVAEQVGLENIRSRCPHFNAWLERLEKLATDAA